MRFYTPVWIVNASTEALGVKSTGKVEPYLILTEVKQWKMITGERDRLPGQMSSAAHESAGLFISQFTAEEIKESLLAANELSRPIEDLIATGEAVFEFIRRSKMKESTKSAFYQLEKRREFYKNLSLK